MKYIVAMDYDGTLFEGGWPDIGDPNPIVINHAKAFQKAGASIVLWTCREGNSLTEALERASKEGLSFDAVNESCPSQKSYQDAMIKANGEVFGSRKIYADIYVDDRAPGSIDHFLKLNPEEECEKNNQKDLFLK